MLSGSALRVLPQGPARVKSKPSTFVRRSQAPSCPSIAERTTHATSFNRNESLLINSNAFRRNYNTTSTQGAPNHAGGQLLQLYHQKVKNGSLRHDKCQENTIARLDSLSTAIVDYEKAYLASGYPSKVVMPVAVSKDKKSSGMWSYMKDMVSSMSISDEIERLKAPKGFYMYGDVGSGKTMLMDLFLEATPLRFKQRVHFNSFMIYFHNELHAWRQTPAAKGVAQSAAIETIADSILLKSPLLCFDEFQVTNIADAMILNRLFHTLWYKGAVVIATSNRVPEDLYKGGLQRENFVPFIHELNGKCVIHDIGSTIDYRLMGERTTHIWNEKSQNPRAISEIWDSLTEKRPGEPSELHLMSRKIQVPKALKGIAMFTFHELCARPLGAADYGLLASEFHTLFITDIPVLNLDEKDLVRRFITLVDELYEHRVKLICSADAAMAKIFPYTIDPKQKGSSTTLVAGEEEIFAFSRTLSRLSEMQTTEYLQSHHLKDPRIRDKV